MLRSVIVNLTLLSLCPSQPVLSDICLSGGASLTSMNDRTDDDT